MAENPDPSRRDILLTGGSLLAMSAIGTGAAGLISASPVRAAASEEIRPFSVHFSDEQLADLRRRVAATKWPSKEIVTDASQGVQFATLAETRTILGD